MRISDWSSDVCSSDLLLDQADVGVLQRFGGGGDLLERGVAVAVERTPEFGQAGLEGVEVLRLLVLHLDEELVGVAELVHDPADGLVAKHAEHEDRDGKAGALRSEEHTSETQSLMRISY